MPQSPPISVIVPTLNEQGLIGRCLESLARTLPGAEILVADGGSRDRTREIAGRFEASGVRLLRAAPGRGPQMNAGAAAATGSILLFLHADVTLPEAAGRWIDEALGDPGVVAGAFRTHTVAESLPAALRPILRLADVRSRWSGLPYGDQALFVRAEVFRRAGGFAGIPLMEDLDLSRRLRRHGKIRTVPAEVTVSARRFVARPVSSAVTMSLFPILFRMGVSPWWLARMYGNPR
ncbi:MAG: TIGR04283 family arsenosugar biosynthesis glycosyltransferase [Acidobacteria bacterium]|nr:TIGR04283 family arsenosugar biosynthesis glycosyltransferase [Acidobacteriota bacterium]